jgi:membrane-anchored mycosin MYCP
MRTASTATRLAVIGAAGLLGLVTAGLPSAVADDDSYATPPPVIPDLVPPNQPPAPDAQYTPKNTCITSAVGQPILKPSWGQDVMRLPDAWRFATGKGQTVAVIDTGVNPHPRLAGRLVGGGDYVEGGKNGTFDCDGHGTEVAGIIAASDDPNSAFEGVAPDATILSIRQTSSNYQTADPSYPGGSRPAGTVDTAARAIRVATDRGANVINVSITACSTPDQVRGNAWRGLQAAVHYAVQHNVVVVAAAGNTKTDTTPGCEQQNDNPDPNKVNVVAMPPWFADDVLSVAASDWNGTPAPFTVWGPWVSVAGPGTNIVSLDPAGRGLANTDVTNGRQIPLQGTSFASPYVAGVVALVKQRFPNLTARQVMHRIEVTAQHPDGAGGRNNKLGYGMVDPVAALTAVLPEEHGTAPAAAAPIRTSLDRDTASWTPMRVALIGTGSGIGILLVTLFVVHATRRVRRRTAGSGPHR